MQTSFSRIRTVQILTPYSSYSISILDPYLLSFSIELNSKLYEYASDKEVCLGTCIILSQSIHSTQWILKALQHNVVMVNFEKKTIISVATLMKEKSLMSFSFPEYGQLRYWCAPCLPLSNRVLSFFLILLCN